MNERFWRLRAALWYWLYGCRWYEVGAAFAMAAALEYIEDRGDVFYETPRDAVLTDISYWEP